MWLIIVLVLAAVFLLVAELILIPGMSVAGIGSLVAGAIAVWRGFAIYGPAGGLIVLAALITLYIAATAISLRARTWKRFSLTDNIDGTSQRLPQECEVKVGDHGVTLTRLAPMGKVRIGQCTFEAKSADAYVDPHREVEVTGFDNFSVIVRVVNE